VNNDFDNMRELYEGYIGIPVDHGPNSKYVPAPAPPNLSYGKPLPGYPEGGRGYDGGKFHLGVNADEEGQSIAKAITLDKVDELMGQSIKHGMDYATIQLAKLKEFIEDL